MKIAFRAPPGTGAYTVLADEDDAADETAPRITGYCPAFGKSPFVTAMFEQPDQLVGDLGNAAWDLVFGIERVHGNPAAAQAWLAGHAALFGGVVGLFDVQITIPSAAGQTVILAASCALRSFKPRPPSDQSTFVEYGWTPSSYGVDPSASD